MSPKDAALELIRTLPDNATWDDIFVGLQSHADTDDSLDPQWTEEINRRVEDLQTGRVKGIPAEIRFPELTEPSE